MKHEETAIVSLGDIMIALEELKCIRKTALENPDCISEKIAEHLQVAIAVIRLFIADHYADDMRQARNKINSILDQINDIVQELDPEEEET